MVWTSVEFHGWYIGLDAEKKRRAWAGMTKEQEKSYREYLTFLNFAKVSPLDIDLRSIENRPVPEPDILCKVAGSAEYFELGEVTDEGLAKRASIAERAGVDTNSGWMDQSAPLLKMITQKCSKTYSCNQLPVSLLLHYNVGHQTPHPQVVAQVASDVRQLASQQFQASPFAAIWFYDGWEQKVLDVIKRDLST
jgi:hypothetical protein